MERRYQLRISLFLVMLILISCVSVSGSESPNKQTIVIWAWDTAVTAAKEAADAYSKTNPDAKVVVVDMAQDDVVTKLNIGLSSKANSEQLPDIVFVEDYNLYGYIKYYPNAFVDLTDKISPALFMPFKLKTMMYNDKLYGVPYDSGVCGLFYRVDIIKAAGYTEDDMRNLTWDKFIEIGKVVKDKTGVDMLPIWVDENMEGRIILQSCGEWYVKSDGSTLNILSNDGLYASISTIDKIFDADIVYEASSWDDLVNSIYNGKVCTIVGACWWAPILKEEKSQAGLWRIAEIPYVTDRKSNSVGYSNLGGASWCVLNNKNKDLSIDFLKNTFASNTDLINSLVSDVGLITTLKSSTTVSNYDVTDDYFGDQLVYKEFVSWGEFIPTVNYGYMTYEINSIVGRKTKEVIRGKDIETAIKEIDAEARLLR